MLKIFKLVQIKQTYGDKETFVTKIDCGRADKQTDIGKLINACWYDASLANTMPLAFRRIFTATNHQS